MKHIVSEFTIQMFNDNSFLVEKLYDDTQYITAHIVNDKLIWTRIEINLESLKEIRKLIMRYYNNRVFE